MCGIGNTLYLKLHENLLWRFNTEKHIAYLHGNIRMLMAFSIIFLKFEFIVL